jgi:hypothetical protein
MVYLISNLEVTIMMILIIIIAIIFLIVILPHCFETYTNTKYIQHLEDMGVFTDENGKEI